MAASSAMRCALSTRCSIRCWARNRDSRSEVATDLVPIKTARPSAIEVRASPAIAANFSRSVGKIRVAKPRRRTGRWVGIRTTRNLNTFLSSRAADVAVPVIPARC